MSEQQTICGPDTEPDFGSFQPIEMDVTDAAPDLDGIQVVEATAKPVDKLGTMKTKIVRKVLGGVMGLPNFYLISRDEEPLISLDLDIYDQQADNLAVKASAQLADMLDLSPATAKWLAKAVDWEERYGDLGQLAGAVLASLSIELKQRAAAKKEKAKEEAEAETPEAETGETPEEAPTMGEIVDEPED